MSEHIVLCGFSCGCEHDPERACLKETSRNELECELQAAREVVEAARQAVRHLEKLAGYLGYTAPDDEPGYLIEAIATYDAAKGGRA